MRSLIVFWAGVVLVAGWTASARPAATQSAARPNVVYVMADDLGYGDLGSYGQKEIQTPNLDRLAREGMRFTQFYAGSTVCAPSRAVLMTGRHMGHVSVRANAGAARMADQSLRPGDRTIGHVFKDAGYATALFGKWGLGEIGMVGHPNRMGFDEFFGFLNQTHAHNYYPSFLVHNSARYPLRNVEALENPQGGGYAKEKVDYAPDVIFEKALAWMTDHQSAPFFLYFSPTLPHANNEAATARGDGQEVPDYGIYQDRPWPNPDKGQAAMITRLDTQVGRLMDALRTAGVDRNTLVIFTSDNGPHQEGKNNPGLFHPAGPLRGMKRSLYEGGVRVPFIARWPGQIAAGSTSDHVGYFGDMLATVTDLTRQALPAGLDSISIVPTLLNRAGQAEHEFIYFEFYEQGGRQSVRFGDWKAIREPIKTGPIQLFDLAHDLGETTNVAAGHADLVARAAAYMDRAHVDDPMWRVQ
ncbi:MAG: arylsulfatase [Acidobacteriota bacterium]